MITSHKPQFSIFHDLMKFRVREILLVSTPYDGFVLEEDGRLSEKIFNEYQDLNLHYVPRIERVSSAEEAFEAMSLRYYDLVITMPRISDMNPLDFGKKTKELYPDKPIVMLTYETISEDFVKKIRETHYIDRIFHWSGNSKILLAIIKYVEDLGNIDNDCKMGVQVILVVDDSPWYYSQFLPMIYSEIVKQSQYLISHAINDDHRLLRARARPKIVMAETYEEAIEIIDKYKKNLLGVISDVSFTINGLESKDAGFKLARKVRSEIVDLPIILQSSESSNALKAFDYGVSFIDKNSPNLLLELREFILENYGFGAFKFRYPSGQIICEASDIEGFEKVIRTLPLESLMYHASNNHFSRWFRARTEFEIAHQMRQKNIRFFDDDEEIREFILDLLAKFFARYQGGIIIDFGLSKMDMDNSFIKLGSGSLGGKGRGIAFFSSLLAESDLQEKYPNVRVKTPLSFILCSDVFEEFTESNDLKNLSVSSTNEDNISSRFLSANLPPKIMENLYLLLEKATYPLAVRSSSILEDSQILPFAGIYKTYILPNSHPNISVRLKQLTDAIKLVYASVFYSSPKQYAKNADLRIEEEKMAVLIQQLIGEKYNNSFYPTFSGVAQSYNFYPISHMKSEQGIVSLALGFGKTIVEGGHSYMFSPAYPRMNPPYSSTNEFLEKSQADYFALDLSKSSLQIMPDENCTYTKLDLSQAEINGTLKHVGSTLSIENDVIVDTLACNGPRLVTFAPILKHNLFPLPDIIKDLFSMGKHAFGTDVEIEFAVNIPQNQNKPIDFYFLQVRPMVVGKEAQEVKIETFVPSDVLLSSNHTIGNGIFDGIKDFIFVDPDTFDLSKTKQISQEIGELNQLLYSENRKCILLGFGRIGTSDPWLGLPLVWSQMSQAKVVVEADRPNLQVEPSLGSHFYHNLTTLKIGYFHITTSNPEKDFINWDKILKLPIYKKTNYVKLVRSNEPFNIKIDGRSNNGVIFNIKQR